ncbi:metal ABC transporter permease [Turicibacter sanguinis]|uniref:Iron chelate uptake ABC transporter family permease subunit n=1 Tax=Turicibacter sanguinis TaxID=154288 RepID=A0A6I3N8P2_9FIRM|nr:metal ABC transporter permease [Turicibacter sanguinis]MTK69955.1 iron chelate uptake ABC transporter family permease subunit [Turicibacter sanguinis]MTK80801.1 iron chelate uptake ABC transporter family permease subunit [Turicibacter sanguinis]MTK83012.1 iron chelate uptake ABC transporter family permease subunit [Turicibacter sanguinis]MTK85301.1 iron chelate uptake ABC transporter family permease subunit [Turicibacter sanguinis]MTK95111.1 iron chelate uptake ABC transporter family permea
MIEILVEMFSYPFLVRALAVASVLNVAPLSFAIPVVVAAAFFLLRMNENSLIKGDAAIALVSTGSLSIGVLVMSLTTGMNLDVCNYMFGSILAMTQSDVYLSMVLSALVLLLFILFYHKMFAITFDETFAKATGIRVGFYKMLLAVLTALTITLGMRLMGTLLISSLIVFPALTAMRLCRSFKWVMIHSIFISFICFFLGLVMSYLAATPPGASVVAMNIVMFFIYSLLSFVSKGVKR